jgi:hypothetical protein
LNQENRLLLIEPVAPAVPSFVIGGNGAGMHVYEREQMPAWSMACLCTNIVVAVVVAAILLRSKIEIASFAITIHRDLD